MAPSASLPTKEALALVVDASPTMAPHLEHIRAELALHMADRTIHAKQDKVVLFQMGTVDASSLVRSEMELANPEDPGYDHIARARPWDLVGKSDLLDAIAQLAPQPHQADVYDALLVATEELVRSVKKLKFSRRILVLTDGASPVEADADELARLADRLIANDVSLTVVAFGQLADAFRAAAGGGAAAADAPPPPPLCAALDALDAKFAAATPATELSSTLVRADWSEAQASWRAPFRKFTRPTRRDAGPLLVGGFKLPVTCWNKVVQGTALAFTRVAKSWTADSGVAAKDSIVVDNCLVDEADPDVAVPAEQTIPAFRFGRDLVPVPAEYGLEASSAQSPSFELHGFVKASAVPPHKMVEPPLAVVGDTSVEGANEALQALCLVMQEEGLAALVRWAPKGKGPRLALLLPSTRCLYLRQLSFADELPALLWPPRPASVPAAPSSEQVEAAEALIDRMQLCGDDHEPLRPKDWLDPRKQRQYQVIKHKAIHGIGAQAPPVDYETMVKPLEPDARLVSRAMDAALALERVCPVREAVALSKRRLWGSGGGDDGADGKRARSRLGHGGVEAMQPLTALTAEAEEGPIESFWRLINDQTTSRVCEALRNLQEAIDDLLDRAATPGDKSGAAAFTCLREMRRACVEQEEPATFNELAQRLKRKWQDAGKADFWAAFAKDAVLKEGLISSDEVEESEVAPADARAFVEAASVAAVPPALAPDAVADEFDDLE